MLEWFFKPKASEKKQTLVPDEKKEKLIKNVEYIPRHAKGTKEKASSSILLDFHKVQFDDDVMLKAEKISQGTPYSMACDKNIETFYLEPTTSV